MKAFALKKMGDVHSSKAAYILWDRVALSFNEIIKMSSKKICSMYFKIFWSIPIKIQVWKFNWKRTFLYNFNKQVSAGYQNREAALAQPHRLLKSSILGEKWNHPVPYGTWYGSWGGISPAMLSHLSFHNKWLSLGKPKQIKLSIRAARAVFKPWFDVWRQHHFSSRHPQLLLLTPRAAAQDRDQCHPNSQPAQGTDLAEK